MDGNWNRWWVILLLLLPLALVEIAWRSIANAVCRWRGR